MANDIKIGIVGVAGRGRGFFAPFVSHPDTQVTALCDVNEDGLAKIAESSGVRETYTDYEAMIEKAGLDAVVIGTPMPSHAPQAIMALGRNIHVLSEVPAAVSYDECRALVAARKASKAVYMMAENYIYTRDNVLVVALAKAGLFGELYFGEGEYIHELKELNEITRWRRKWQTGINGNTYPTHSIGPVYQWFGNRRVREVLCYGTGHHYQDPRGDYYENEDSTFTACRLEGGGLVNLRLDMLSNRPHNCGYLSIQGTKGCFEKPRGHGDKPKVYLADRHEYGTWHDLEELAEEFLPEIWLHPSEEALRAGHGGGDYMQIFDFVNAIKTATEPPIGIYESLDMTLPGLASQESIAKGSVWTEVPDPRQF